MSDFSALNAAVTGLYAHRQRIDVISDNIANAETPGYHRRITTLSPVNTNKPGLFSGPGALYGGVEASVGRRWDALLDANVKQGQSRASSLGTQAMSMERLEAEIGRLSGGLADDLQTLFASFDDLANDPSEVAVRNVVLGNAQAVAGSLNYEADVLSEARSGAVFSAESSLVRVNAIITEVAELDRAIVSALSAGDTASGLLDQRDTLTTELAGLVDVRVTYELDGQSRVTLDGHSLVADGQASLLQMTTVPDAGLAALGYDRPALATLGGRVIGLNGGAIHGHLQLANELVPEQRRGLDAVAASIATTVNALHAAGAGLDGSTGNNLFDPAGLTASSFAVSADVLGQPSKIAASDGSGVLDNSVALALASLGTAENGPAAAHADFITSLGTRVQTLMSRSQAADLASARAVANERADTGVSLDEELADLVSAQRAYEASARMITTIDQMLDTLINRTGLVGR